MATVSNLCGCDAIASLTPARFPVNWLCPKAIENVLRLQLFDMNVLDQRKCLHSENIHTKIGKNVHSTKGEHIKNKCNVNHNSASLSPSPPLISGISVVVRGRGHCTGRPKLRTHRFSLAIKKFSQNDRRNLTSQCKNGSISGSL